MGPVRNVEIIFKPEVSHMVKRNIWHPTQTLKEKKDGSLVLKMRVSCYIPLISWILGWGENAEIIKPESIRSEVTRIAKEMSESY